MEAGGGGRGEPGIDFHKGAKSKGVSVTTGGVSATGVPFTGNSSPVPSVASVDSIFSTGRKKTSIKSHMTVNLIAEGESTDTSMG